MLEKFEFATSAVLASTLVVAMLASGLHARSVVKAMLNQGAIVSSGSDDKRMSLDAHHHTHISRFSADSMRQVADQRALRKYLHFDQRKTEILLD